MQKIQFHHVQLYIKKPKVQNWVSLLDRCLQYRVAIIDM